MKGAEEDYLELERKLDEQIRQMESTHPGYDEYRYQLDEIGHDPYQLISHLTAVYEQFTRGQVKTVIKSLFEQQYLLKVWETIEIRTRMETRVGIRPTIGALTQSELYEKTISNMLECKSRGAYLMGLTTYGKYEIEDQVNFTVYVPKMDEHFVGSLAVIPLQLLGYYVSVAKGLDVDKPRNLAKSVTVE